TKMARGLTPKLPLVLDEQDGVKLVKNFPDLVDQNLRNLLLTLPGERIMDPSFGVGVARYLFEQNDPITYAELQAKIEQQVQKYLPFVRIDNIQFTDPSISDNPNYVGLIMTYTIIPIKSTKTMNL
ncbi:MAG TPA: hypothetical protein DCM40_14710, partial [Maribacter sp.]|nr:hypothetical protein [Maribacter sp.]